MQVARNKRHIIERGRNVTIKGDFSSETMQSTRQGSDIVKVMKGKKTHILSTQNSIQRKKNLLKMKVK